MYRGQTVGVVVPAYNERGHITDVLAAMPAFVDRIYVVDDASTDGTWEEVKAFVREKRSNSSPSPNPSTARPDTTLSSLEGAEDLAVGDRIVSSRHVRNRGAGGAIKTGYRLALEDGIDVTVTIDADGQMDPRQMAHVVDPIVSGHADYAKGNRLQLAAGRGEMPTFRWVGNWLLTGLTKVASGYWHLRDPQNGYTAISRRALSAIHVETLFEFYGYSNDVLVRLNAAEMRVADVPMPAAYGDEDSSIRYATYVPNVAGLLLRRFLWRLHVRYVAPTPHPVALCYLLGTLVVAAGLAQLLATVTAGRVGLVAGPSAIGPVIALGGLFAAVGMAFDRQANRGLEVTVE